MTVATGGTDALNNLITVSKEKDKEQGGAK